MARLGDAVQTEGHLSLCRQQANDLEGETFPSWRTRTLATIDVGAPERHN